MTSRGQSKLCKHRDTAIMRKGVSPSEYASNIGLSPQRIAGICSGRVGASAITVEEADKLLKSAKIRMSDWLLVVS